MLIERAVEATWGGHTLHNRMYLLYSTYVHTYAMYVVSLVLVFFFSGELNNEI